MFICSEILAIKQFGSILVLSIVWQWGGWVGAKLLFFIDSKDQAGPLVVPGSEHWVAVPQAISSDTEDVSGSYQYS
jgi:hypothetical protein